MTTTDLRFGLVGFGLWGTHHARAIEKTAGARLAAIAVRSEKSRAAARAAHPGVDVQDDYRELLARDDIDIVDVVLPNYLHHEVGLAALQSGRHVLIEKPLALRLDHCDALVEAATNQEKILAVGFELRLSSLWGRVKEIIDAGGIGEPRYALIELSRHPYREGSQGWRYDIDRVGDWLLEEPVHFFDLARWYLSALGDPVSVYARANSRQVGGPELQDNFGATVNFAGDGFAVIAQTLAAFEHHVQCKVTGTTGALWAHWSGPDARSDRPAFGLRHLQGDRLEEIPFTAMTGEVVELEEQIATVIRCVRENESPVATGLDGRWSVLLCLAAQRSVTSGGVVTLKDM